MFIWSWLASFKLLSLCFDRGPLVGSWTLAQFIIILSLPIYPLPPQSSAKSSDESASSAKLRGRLADDAGSPAILLARWVAKVCGL